MPFKMQLWTLRNEALCPKREGWDSKVMTWALKGRAFLPKVCADLVARGARLWWSSYLNWACPLEQPDGTCSEHGVGLEASQCPL